MTIAIDGPAGAGKSTVARGLASRLDLPYVDSGATYRAAALKVLESGVPRADARAVIDLIDHTEIEFVARDGDWRIWLDGRDVTPFIRTPQVTLAAAEVSRLPEVRKKLIALQRNVPGDRGVVMEGRDIGTVVFPEAPLKVFLEADPAERARRRLRQEEAAGRRASLTETADEIRRRDQLDAQRKVSPLVPAVDAVRIDSTHLTAEEVVDQILGLAKREKLIERTDPR
ncbi:MAG TPA: (d)CMP kinase [Terriglobia bacterium]